MSPQVYDDADLADRLIAEAVKAPTWKKHKAWVEAFAGYVAKNCAFTYTSRGLIPALKSELVTLAYLAHIHRQNPAAKTRVDSARNAINLLRSFANLPPLNDHIPTRMLAKSARHFLATAPKQSNGMRPIFLSEIRSKWYNSPDWTRRQLLTVAMVTFCTVARMAETVAIPRDGVVWVRQDGITVQDPSFVPTLQPDGSLQGFDRRASRLIRPRGVMLLFITRKNKANQPSWIPLMDRATLIMLARHIATTDRRFPGSPHLFIARPSKRCGFDINRHLRTDDVRNHLREALRVCVGLTSSQALAFGTHSLRIGALNLLCDRGVPRELRSQLGGWMSQASALRYLQRLPHEQFDVLERI